MYQCVGCGGATESFKDGQRCRCGWSYIPCRKPPLGLMPRRIHEEQRISDIAGAINRYLQAGRAVPMEWIEEYNQLIKNNS